MLTQHNVFQQELVNTHFLNPDLGCGEKVGRLETILEQRLVSLSVRVRYS